MTHKGNESLGHNKIYFCCARGSDSDKYLEIKKNSTFVKIQKQSDL
jgi:hypothetical protein